MTVQENLEMGAYLPGARARLAAGMEEVTRLFPRLGERSRQLAGTLSGGEQQMLAIGRALMSRPRALLLDEPSLGLAPLLVKEIFRIIQAINRQGTTILLVEQNVRQALEVAGRAYVLETGRIRLSGAGRELLRSPHVRKAYLGL
jgi:branched-chain amino acid transport system ATP-binding protein